MKKFLTLMIIMYFLNSITYAIEFDTSIDTQIRKTHKIEGEDDILPALPNAAPSKITETPIKVSTNATGKTYTLKNGTKIILVSKRPITNNLQRGTKVTFTNQNSLTTKEGAIIPSGTLFRGTVTNSHSPQLTGNGALVEININEIFYNGVQSEIKTTLNNANYKKIFFNDIKGQRKYWKNTSKLTTPGKKVFKATKNASLTMASIPVINIISFIPITGGSIFYTLNAVVSPVIAIFSKGGNISLPTGTNFEIKLKCNSKING